MKKALIVSVGGSAQPVIFSINSQKPTHVIYFTSKDSRRVVREEIEPAMKCRLEDHDIIDTPDPNNLVKSVEKLMAEMPRKLANWGIDPGDVTGDYTGGTKTMSAALVLALADYGSPYCYIGGEKRNKKGLGTVIEGHEEMVTLENPWDVLAINDLKSIALLFNKCRFRSAEDLAGRNVRRTHQKTKFFQNLRNVIEGYRLWDNFQYSKAPGSIARALSWFESVAEITNKEVYYDFARAISDNLAFLETVKNHFHWLAQGQACQKKRPPEIDGKPVIMDLLANAVRRGEVEHKYDDAVARIYSALEKMAKTRLLFHYGMDNSNLDLAAIPVETVRQKLESEPRNSGGLLQLPLMKSYQLLADLNDELGIKYSRRAEDLRNVMDVRNLSLLAHGFNAIKEGTYQDLKGIALDFLGVKAEDLPVFPRMDWQDALISA